MKEYCFTQGVQDEKLLLVVVKVPFRFAIEEITKITLSIFYVVVSQ